MFKRIFSYLIPINIYQKNSGVSKSLEVTWTNGQLVLDSKNTNYSYGSLQRVLRKGLKKIGAAEILQMKHILVLGVAGGSVIKSLVDEFNYKGRITGVEIDEEVIAVANDYFKIDKIQNLQIIIDDAFEFVLKTKEKYDLIIIDVFQDDTMPAFLFERFFADRLGEILNSRGYMLFNTMTLTGVQDARNEEYIAGFDENIYEVQTIPRIENHNELIVIRKLA